MALLTVIAGPNGSGKSTLTQKLIAQGVSFGEYLNADDIAQGLKGSSVEVSSRAQQLVRERREAALKNGQDHTFETVMSHPSHIEYMQTAARAGFRVHLFFVATEDPVINLDRVSNRVKHGGHSVPPDRILSRYARSLENLPKAIAAAHTSMIFDNSTISRPLRQLAHINNLHLHKARGLSIIKDQGLNDIFLEHVDVARAKSGNAVDARDIPVWWLEILLRIKSNEPLADVPPP
ncbi:MAG: zeta toxin family protein [Novosphingobium sp.]